MRKKIAIGIILIGLFVLALPTLSELMLRKEDPVVEVANVSVTQLTDNAKKEEKRNFDPSKIAPININGVVLNREKADMSKLIGQIVIPSINKNIALFDGLENNNLMYGACTMKPKQTMGLGNFAVAGHYCKNDKILFGGLMNTKHGDIIKLTNKKTIYEYKVVDTKKVADTELNLINDGQMSNYGGKAIISLMTCYYNEPGFRYFVIGQFNRLYPYTEEKMLDGITD